jgi:hypothetical protein
MGWLQLMKVFNYTMDSTGYIADENHVLLREAGSILNKCPTPVSKIVFIEYLKRRTR